MMRHLFRIAAIAIRNSAKPADGYRALCSVASALSLVFAALSLLSLAVTLTLTASASPAFAGQTITIDGNVGHTVYGNGTPPDGSGTAGDPSNNTVNINNGGTVTGGGDVFGGYVYSAGSATANDNRVTVNSGGTVTGTVYGGRAAGDTAATASGNTVIINGGTVNEDVYGGYAEANSTATATAQNNRVFINGGEVDGNVYGGYADATGGSATATYNTVTISGAPTFGGGTALLGGGSSFGTPQDMFTGNTLNVWNYHGSPVAWVGNFQYFNFLIPSIQSGPVLTVTGDAYLYDHNTGKGGSTVTAVNTYGGLPPIPAGGKVTLIQAGTLHDTDFTQKYVQGQHGATISSLWTLDTANNELTATAVNVQASPQTKALSEGFLGGLAMVNQGADLLAGKGMSDAVDSSRRARGDGGFGFGSFGSVSGGWSRYNTGSHVDMSSLSLIAGLSFGAALPPGRLTLGAFFEYGTGSYNTYNSFSNAADVDGKGNTYYLGGGILGRMDFLDTGPGNFYLEASGRMGGLHNDYNTSDLRDATGRSAGGYDTFSPYYGIHAGLGYIWKFTEAASLDLYGKYFWTHQQGESVTLSTGDPVKFKDTDSHRVRLGGRFSYAVNDHVAPYIGAAWEYEMDGRQRATTYDSYSLNKPSLYGSTGIGELGLNLKPSKDLPLSFDLGVQGYLGKREGVTGSLQAKWEF